MFNKNTNENYNYDVKFASLLKRFFAILVDRAIFCIIIFIFWNITIGVEIKKAFESYTTNQVNVEINENFKDNNTIKIAENLNVVATEGQKINVKKVIKALTEKEKYEITREVLLKNKEAIKAFAIVSILLYLFYNVIFLLLKKQATIGQQIFNLQVIRRNGKSLDLFTILNRVLLFMISSNLLVIPFSIIIPYIISKENATLYDFVSGTRVVEITKEIQK